MKKRLSLLFLSSLFAAGTAYAQQKISDGTTVGESNLPNKDAMIELESKFKGLLFSRVELVSTTNPAPLQGNKHIAGMMVYNTAASNDVVPGIYYNDGKKWIAAGSSTGATNISYNPTTYEISFVDASGNPITINLTEVVKKNETITTLVSLGEGKYEYTSENGTKTIINVPADVIQNFETIVKEENVKNAIINLIKNVGGNVYYDGDKFTYITETGETKEITIKEIVQANETITTLVSLGEGKYEYTSENGTKTIINVPADVIQNFETIVKEENVKNAIINLIKNVGGNVYYDGDKFTYITETGETKEITIKEIVQANETVTTLVALGGGKYEYTSENGTKTLIDVPASVVENFETIVNEGPVTINGDTFNTIEDYITHLANNVSNISGSDFITVSGTGTTADPYKISIKEGAANSMLVTNAAGQLEWATIESIVKANETLTTLVPLGGGKYEYTSENGTKTLIDVPASVVENFETIVNEGPVTINGDTFNTIEDYITHLANNVSNISGSDFITVSGTGTTADPYKVSIKEGAANSLLITNKDGQLEWATIESIVKANETLTTLVPLGGGKYEYTSENGTKTLIDVPASVVENFETIVNEGPVTINGDTFNTIEDYITHLANNVSNISGSDFITVTGTGTTADPYKVSIKEGAANSMLVTNASGQLEWATIESIVKDNETVTTLVKGTDGKYTYTSEDNTVTVIDIPASVVENFETIVNEGPVTVNGDTFNTIEDYITHLANNVSNISGSDFITVTGTGTAADPYKVSIKEGAANSMLVTNASGQLEWATIESIVQANETVTTLVNNGDGTYTYTNEKNIATVIDVKNDINALETLTTIALNADNTNIDYKDEDGNTTQLNLTALVKNLETLTTVVENADGTFTYKDEQGNSTTIDVSNLETLTTIALNADNTNIDYKDEDGNTTQLNLTALVKNLETLTTVVENADGTFTYKDEQGNSTTIDVSNLETLTTIALNADNTNIDYKDEDGNITQLNLTALVKNLETLTTVVENADGTFTYKDEQGNSTTIDVSNLETLTTIALNADNTNIDYKDEDGNITQLNLTALVKNLETLTTVVENADGTFTYKDEQGNSTTIDVSNLETLTTIALNADNTNIDYKDEDGNITQLNLTALVKNLETLTTVVENADGTFTYKDEQGNSTTIDVSNLETLTTIALNADNTNIDYKDEDGNITQLNLTALVKNLETLTTVVENADGTFTYKDEQGNSTTIDVSNLETLTTIALNADNTNIDYKDEDGNTTQLNLTALVKNLETLTTVVENADGTFTYKDEQGNSTTIDVSNLETLTTIALNADNTNIDYKDEDGNTTQLNLTALVKNLETLTTVVENADGTFTYKDEQGNSTTIDVSNLETLTTIALNADNTNIDYKDEDGNTTQLNLTALVKNLETLTTVVENADGTFTYKDEQGNSTTIDVSNLETLTTIALNADNTNIDYKDEDGNITQLNLTALVKNLETLTTVVENADGTFTYKDEQGNSTTIDVSNLETLTTIALNADNTNIDYKDEDGNITQLNLTALVKNLETLTTVVENADGTFTYKDEQGNSTTIDVSNLETLTTIALNADNTNIDYKDEDGNITQLNLTALVKNLETLTTVVENADGTFTYKDEQGNSTTIDVSNLETLTTIALNADNTNIDYKDEDGNITQLNLTALVKNLETLTTVVENADGTFTYKDEQGNSTTIDVSNLETLTTIALNADNTNIDYKDEDGNTTQLNLTALVKNLETLTTVVENADGTFTYKDEQGNSTTIDVSNLETLTTIALNADNTNIDYKDEDGNITQLNLTALVKNLETLTTVVENADGTFTYKDEQGNSTTIDVSNLETLTTIALNADNTNIDYKDEDGNITQLNLTALVKNLETLTTVVENADGTFTYKDEQGNSTTIDVSNLETLTTIALNADNTNIDYKDEDGNTTQLNLTALVKNLETLTTVVENADGTFTYKDEQGNSTTIDVSNLETLTTIALNADNTNIDYKDEDGNITQLNLTALVKNLETLTTVVENADGTFTYKDEQGNSTTIDVSNLETLTTIALNADNTNIDYKDEDGNITQLNLTALVKNLETLTTVVENADGTFTYKDEQGNSTTIDVSNLETLTTIALNADNTNIDYKDEDGNITQLNLTALVKNLETLTSVSIDNNAGTLTYVDEDGDSNVLNLANLIKAQGKDLTAADGAAATIEVASGGVKSVLVETSLRVKAESITTSQIKDGTIAPIDIAKAGNDQVLVTDENGNPKWVPQSDIATEITADNGLGAIANNVQLGGKLLKETIITQDGQKLEIATLGSQFVVSGLDKKKVQATDATAGVTQHLLAVGSDNVVKALKAAMPKFFYMPSIVIPLAENQITLLPGESFANSTRAGKLDLYARYTAQFNTTVKSSGAPALPVLPSNQLHYYITYFDTTVFDSVSVSDTGELTYKVNANVDITAGTFMNIVFAVKEDN
ncbi:hypothetical protein [Sphingobacterium sp. SYP-B4668]|uniref:hypothetical protein n=1 Tax=Sphingobacterium sp. SYP-B4668 TaxID=2996035 RepID=UPI0022DD8E26|nr:hypothetical protein [Sphingobacterium sp. SYP-B4668]